MRKVIDETPEIAQNGLDFSLHPKIRRWEQYNTPGGTPTATENGVTITYGWQDLEGGIQVKFSTSATYKTGDYWLIPARGVTDKIPGQIEWPTDPSANPSPQPPLGIQHHYCRLAFIQLVDRNLKVVEDCHRQFPPLTEIGRGCCLVTVGKGGEYNDIQGAVNAAFALQKQSSDYNFVKICILPGRYQLDASVVIQDGRRIIISGCDRQAKIEGPSNKPAFQLEECNIIIFDALEIVAASGQEAILVNDSQKIIVTNCGISNGKGSVPSVSIQANFVRIVGNILHSLWIRDGSEDILIQDNEFLVKDIQENPTPKIFIDPDKGLDCSHTTEIELPSPVTSVLLLLHNSTPQSRATVVALDQNNGEVERKTTISTEETLTLSGTNQIKRVVITAPQHETWLRQFCFGDRPEEVTTYQAGIVVL
jgi:hypothetical protein